MFKAILFAILLGAGASTVGGCYPGGVGAWKTKPQAPIPLHCQAVSNPCGQPWAYPPLTDARKCCGPY